MTGTVGLEASKRKVPRGPHEWGKVLVEPDWVYERKRKDIFLFYFGWGMVAVGAIMPLLVWFTFPKDENLDPIGMVSFILMGPVFFMAIGTFMLVSNIKMMPFRIYEAGFTKEEIPALKGGKFIEELIPKERICKVEIESMTISDNIYHHISITYKEGMEKETTSVGSEMADDPLAVLTAFKNIVPDKLDDSVFRYIGTNGADPVIETPGTQEKNLNIRRVFLWMFPIMGISLAFFAGALFSFSPERTWTTNLLSGAFIAMVPILTLVPTLFMARFFYLCVVAARAWREGERILLPEMGPYGAFVTARSWIHLEEVKEVRRGLEKGLFYSIARIRLTNGEMVDVPHDVYEDLGANPGFDSQKNTLMNIAVDPKAGPPVVRMDHIKGLAWSIVFILVAIVAGVISFMNPELNMDTVTSNEGTALISILMLASLTVMFILYIRSNARNLMIVKGMIASDKGITIPNAPDDWKHVEAHDIKGIRVRKTFWGHCLEMETTRGGLALPICAYEVLEKGGWRVKDPTGVLPRIRD